MSIKISFFYPELQKLAGGQSSLEVSGGTIEECLNDMIKRYPGARRLLFDDSGRLLKHVFVYLNAESLHPPALTEKVKDGDTILVAVLVTGG